LTHLEPRANVALNGDDSELLRGLGLVDEATNVTTAESLEDGDEFTNLPFASLFDLGEFSDTEENLSETVLDLAGVNDLAVLDNVFNDGLGGSLGVRGLAGNVVGEDVVTLKEGRVFETVRETHARDLNALKHTVAAKLIEDNVVIDGASLLDVVGDNAANEVRVSVAESRHEVLELLSVVRSDSDEGGTLASLTLGSAGSDITFSRGLIEGELLHELNDLGDLRGAQALLKVVLERIAVLLEPIVGVVFDATGIMLNLEGEGLGELSLDILRMLTIVEAVELLSEGLIGGLGEDGFFIENDEDTLGLP